MFQPVERLGNELEQLAAAGSHGSKKLSQQVAEFVSAVAEEVDLAFSDVHEILREVAFLPESQVSADKIRQLQNRLSGTYARDKFKNVLGICDRLGILAECYQHEIAPQLPGGADAHRSSQLFWLLEKHEGAFIYTIRNAVDEVIYILDRYQSGGGIDEARQRASMGLRELESGLAAVLNARNRVVASLPGGASKLLTNRAADEVLRRNPWFAGSFYLAAAIILLTALTVVAGNTSAVTFPIVVAGSFAGLTIIGAFQLKNDDRLSERTFVQLIDLSMRRVLLPLSRRRSRTDAV